MKSTRVYIIVVETNGKFHISQEGYHDYETAKNFILTRSDNPQQTDPFRFESAETVYCIHDILCV